MMQTEAQKLNAAAARRYRDRLGDEYRESHRKHSAKFREKHGPLYGRKWRRDYQRSRRRRDPAYRIVCNLRTRLNDAMKGKSKSETTRRLLGCSQEFLKGYLEAQFQDGMTWKNYGLGTGKWQVDHIIPCCAFDLTDPSERAACFHYSNLQPLWGVENRKKWKAVSWQCTT